MVLLFIFVNVKNNKKNDKTRPYEKSTHFPSLNFLRNLERIFLFLLISAAVAGCTSDDDLGDITGKYGKLTGETDTYIEITQLKDGYRMNCRYQEYLEDEQREEIYRWETLLRTS